MRARYSERNCRRTCQKNTDTYFSRRPFPPKEDPASDCFFRSFVRSSTAPLSSLFFQLSTFLAKSTIPLVLVLCSSLLYFCQLPVCALTRAAAAAAAAGLVSLVGSTTSAIHLGWPNQQQPCSFSFLLACLLACLLSFFLSLSLSLSSGLSAARRRCKSK